MPPVSRRFVHFILQFQNDVAFKFSCGLPVRGAWCVWGPPPPAWPAWWCQTALLPGDAWLNEAFFSFGWAPLRPIVQLNPGLSSKDNSDIFWWNALCFRSRLCGAAAFTANFTELMHAYLWTSLIPQLCWSVICRQRVRSHNHTHRYMYVYIYIYAYYADVYMYIYIHIYLHIICIHIYAYIHAYIHAYVCIYIYRGMYVYTPYIL